MRPMLSAAWRAFKRAPCAILLLLLAAPAAAQEWSRFRGPNGSGESEAQGIPVQWTEKDYRWKVELPGAGYSSPVLWADRLIVTSAMDNDATLVVQCLEAATGKTIWRRAFASRTHDKHQFNGYASSTPAVDAQRVYFCYANPRKYTVAAVELADGRDAWSRDLGPFRSEHGFGSSPLLYGGMLIVANEQDGPSSVVALDAATGQDRWTCARRTEKAAFSTPCVFEPEGGPAQIIVSSWAHGPSGIDPKTGRMLWEAPVFRNRVVGSPLVAGGLVFATAGTGGIGRQMVAVRPGDAAGTKAEVVYEPSGSLPYVCTPVARGDLLFSWFDKGVVTCLDVPTGKTHWRERIGGDYFSSPVRVGGRVYNATRDGEMVVLAAEKEYKLLARFPLGERTHATPAVAGGVMYLRTVSHAMAVGGGAGP